MKTSSRLRAPKQRGDLLPCAFHGGAGRETLEMDASGVAARVGGAQPGDHGLDRLGASRRGGGVIEVVADHGVAQLRGAGSVSSTPPTAAAVVDGRGTESSSHATGTRMAPVTVRTR